MTSDFERVRNPDQEVWELVRAWKAPFLVSTVSNKLGLDPHKVRRILEKLEEEKKVKCIGYKKKGKIFLRRYVPYYINAGGMIRLD